MSIIFVISILLLINWFSYPRFSMIDIGNEPKIVTEINTGLANIFIEKTTK
jgi:hypothetical protein